MTTSESPAWSGVNHLALVTSDMDSTVRFYHGVLGMPLVANLAAGTMRHYFFRCGPQSTIAFFQWDGADIASFEKPAGMPFDFPAQFDHLSLTLPDEAALVALQQRLIDHDVQVTPIVDHGFVRSVYFHDNNGIALEASWWVLDPTVGEVSYDGSELIADPSPVEAVRELAATGELAWLPASRLASAHWTAPAPAVGAPVVDARPRVSR
jgi:catechol 2,3-dioxygenase-like lactoylglutathione lyase family enzyme